MFFEDDITEIGDDYYRICFAPLGANDCIRFIPTGEVYPRAFWGARRSTHMPDAIP